MPSTKNNPGRVLVFVIAYHAEPHLVSVFKRIPPELFDDENVRFLCIDDASGDDGPELLTDWVENRGLKNVSVFRNPVNQGYGGNQKLGYRAAIDGGFDFVIMLHGDGQYAPELLPKLIELRREQDADIVLGSRMLDPGEAKRGGMPMYKRVGNRLLTWIQNRLTGLGLSEYHTGYRGYSVSFLRRVPFEANTNDFHFDTQILLQGAYVGAKFVEFAIPTHYGDEICHVSGMSYAYNVVTSTIQYRMHQMGMLCSLKYRDLAPIRYEDKTHHLYSSHSLALNIVKKTSPKKVLDIGCGPGFVAHHCENLGAEVTGVDSHQPIPGQMTHFHQVDLELAELPVDPMQFDVVLLLDVIEHHKEPEQFLISLRQSSNDESAKKDPPLFVISTPNVAFAMVRLNLLLGRFNYAERGILDISHKRLFTSRSLRRTLKECGFQIRKVHAIGVPFQVVMGGGLARLLQMISNSLAWIWPSMFAFQFLVECEPYPSVRQILRRSEPVSNADMVTTWTDVASAELKTESKSVTGGQ